MGDNARPATNVVEVNAEEVMQQFYGANAASAMVVDEKDGEYEVEIWYEGDLRRDPRAFDYRLDDGWRHVAGIGRHLDDDMVELHYLMSRNEETLDVMPLAERYGLRPTSYDRVFVEEGVNEPAIQQGGRLTDELECDVVLAQTTQIDEHVAWGYLDGYDLLVVAYDSTLPPDLTTELIETRQEYRS